MGKRRAQIWGPHSNNDAYEVVQRLARELGPIGNAQQVCELLSPVAFELERGSVRLVPQEIAWMVMLDVHGWCEGVHEFGRGQRDRVAVDLTDAFREAVRTEARYLILAHQHPSGDPSPSPADAELTREAARGGTQVDLYLLDHVVIGWGEAFSFREEIEGRDPWVRFPLPSPALFEESAA